MTSVHIAFCELFCDPGCSAELTMLYLKFWWAYSYMVGLGCQCVLTVYAICIVFGIIALPLLIENQSSDGCCVIDSSRGYALQDRWQGRHDFCMTVDGRLTTSVNMDIYCNVSLLLLPTGRSQVTWEKVVHWFSVSFASGAKLSGGEFQMISIKDFKSLNPTV